MTPNNLTERVTLQVSTEVADGGGGFAETWIDIVAVWARVTQIEAAEAFAAGLSAVRTVLRVTVRYPLPLDVTVTRADRFTWLGRSLDIVAVSPPQRGYQTVLCEERQP